MLRSGQGYPQEPMSSQLPHDVMPWSKVHEKVDNKASPSVNDLLASSLQGL